MAGTELYSERQPRHRKTWTWAAIVLMLVFLLGGEVIAIEPARVWGLNLDDTIEPWWELAYVLAVAFGAGALLLLAWVWLFERRGPRDLGFNRQGLVRFAKGYAGGLIALVIVVGGISVTGGYRVEAGGAFAGAAPMTAWIALGALLLGFIIQGSTEELFMRGWLMQLMASRHGVWAAIIANSAIFSLLHGANISPSNELIVGLLNIVLVGLFLSLYAVRERSIWGVCGWHAAWNWLLGLGFGLEVSGQAIDATPLVADLAPKAGAPWWLTGGAFGPEASLVTTAVLGAGVVWLLTSKAERPPINDPA